MKKTFSKTIRTIFNYFMQGLLLIIPITITVYALYQSFIALDSILNLKTPGLGIIIIVAGVTIIGFFGSTIILKPFFNYLNKLINKAPLIKIIYSAVKDLLSAFVGKKKKFTEPILVTIDKNNGIEKFGFITKKDLSDFGIKDDKIAVYLPYSYGLMGELFVVPKTNVTLIDASSTDVMKFIVSGGVVD